MMGIFGVFMSYKEAKNTKLRSKDKFRLGVEKRALNLR
jgi:hypothetical protein